VASNISNDTISLFAYSILIYINIKIYLYDN